jgi:hypothetical protein
LDRQHGLSLGARESQIEAVTADAATHLAAQPEAWERWTVQAMAARIERSKLSSPNRAEL